MVNDVIKDLSASFEKAIEAFKRELGKVRTGRANIALLDGIKVEYYGTMTPLNQVATLNVPDPRLITIKPWEKSLVPAIEKAIKAQSELGLNPASDGELVRLPIPPLTQERRKDLVKLISKFAEEGRVAVRQVRHDANKELKTQEDAGTLPADDAKRQTGDVQKMTDRYIALVDELLKKKTAEVMEV